MTIKLIAFDLDGTLLDSVPDLFTATNNTLVAMDYPEVSETQVRDWVGNGSDVLLARAITREMDGKVSPQLAQEAAAHFTHFYNQTGHRGSKLYPRTKETLAALVAAGYTLALVTNKPTAFIPAILEQQGLGSTFESILGGDCVTRKKPDPEALQTLMSNYALLPSQVMMVGDSKNDIFAAKNAGCVSVGLPYGYNHGEPIEKAEPDHVIQDLSELPPLLSTYSNC